MMGTSVRYSCSDYIAQNDVHKLKDGAIFLARLQKADLPLVNPDPAWMLAQHVPIVDESCDLKRCSAWILILKIDMRGLFSFLFRVAGTAVKVLCDQNCSVFPLLILWFIAGGLTTRDVQIQTFNM